MRWQFPCLVLELFKVLESLALPSKFKFLNVDLGNATAVSHVLLRASPPIELVMHFAAIAYVGECKERMAERTSVENLHYFNSRFSAHDCDDIKYSCNSSTPAWRRRICCQPFAVLHKRDSEYDQPLECYVGIKCRQCQ